MLNCNKASLLASRALDEKLPFGSRIMLKLHLLLCKNCRNFSKQLELLQIASRDTRIKTQFTLSEEAKQRISNSNVIKTE